MAEIYKTTNLINGKIYIGQTNGKYKKKGYKGSGIILVKAFKKYGGRANFKYDTIIEGDFNQNLLNELEIHYIQLYNATDRKIGYNLSKGGANPNNGLVVSQETREKIRQSLLGRKKSKEFCERDREIWAERKANGIFSTYSGKPINCINITNNETLYFTSIRNAAKFLKIPEGSISNCLANLVKITNKKYKFFYA